MNRRSTETLCRGRSSRRSGDERMSWWIRWHVVEGKFLTCGHSRERGVWFLLMINRLLASYFRGCSNLNEEEFWDFALTWVRHNGCNRLLKGTIEEGSDRCTVRFISTIDGCQGVQWRADTCKRVQSNLTCSCYPAYTLLASSGNDQMNGCVRILGMIWLFVQLDIWISL